jgi:co-chaperonin GroES (HSP10)
MSEMLPLGAGLFPAQGSFRYKHKISKLAPLKDKVLVRNMNFSGRKLSSGIVLLGDDSTTAGIRPRWAQVYATGPEQTDIAPGQWVMVEHGRWSRGIDVEIDDEHFTLRLVDPKSIMFVSDTEPDVDDTLSSAVQAESKTR